MNKDLKMIECDPECGFMVKSHNEMEVMEMAKSHVKKQHDKDVSREELRGMMRSSM